MEVEDARHHGRNAESAFAGLTPGRRDSLIGAVGEPFHPQLTETVAHVFRLDEDLSRVVHAESRCHQRGEPR